MYRLMRGLIKSILVIAVLITLGAAASVIMANDLSNRETVAYTKAVKEGRDRGNEVGARKGNENGYQEGSMASYTGSREAPNDYGAGFYFTYNPTYADVQELFDGKGRVSTWQIHDYAEANGMRVAYVRVQIAREAAEGKVSVYRLVAFETVDKGFIIIEPWSHRVVTVEAGKNFRELNGFAPPSYDDTITKISIIW